MGKRTTFRFLTLVAGLLGLTITAPDAAALSDSFFNGPVSVLAAESVSSGGSVNVVAVIIAIFLLLVTIDYARYRDYRFRDVGYGPPPRYKPFLFFGRNFKKGTESQGGEGEVINVGTDSGCGKKNLVGLFDSLDFGEEYDASGSKRNEGKDK